MEISPTTCPTTPLGCPECAEYIRETMASIGDELGPGCEITVSTAPPLVAGPFEAPGYECPHGVTYWVQPTGEQIAAWAAEGIR